MNDFLPITNRIDLVAKQRQKERQWLKLFLVSSLVGSLAFHAIAAITIPLANVWQPPEAAPDEEETEVIIGDEVTPEPEQAIAEPPVAPEPEVALTTTDVAPPPPPPLAPDTQAPLTPGEDAPSRQPPAPGDPVSPLTSATGDTAITKGGSGPITSPDGKGSGYGNAKVPTGFNPFGRPDGDAKGVSGGTPGGVPGGTLGGTPGGTGTGTTATRSTPPDPAPATPAGKSKPTCLECPKPKYRGAEGAPRVTYDIAPDGRVVNVRLRKSSGNADTDRETLEALSKWRFDPKTVPQGGQSDIKVRVTFEEQGSNFQRQNEQRRQSVERQRVAEDEKKRREAERSTPPATATKEPPAKPAAPERSTSTVERAAPSPPAYVPPAAEPAYAPPAEPAYVPPPEPAYVEPPAVEAAPAAPPAE